MTDTSVAAPVAMTAETTVATAAEAPTMTVVATNSRRGHSLRTAGETTVTQVINSDKIKPSLNSSELPSNFICGLIFCRISQKR